MHRLLPPSGITILVVDDDPNFRCIMADVLGAEGCRVAQAGNGREALEVLRSITPDLVLLDLSMPVMDGWELVEILRRDPRFDDIPVAVLSSHLDSELSSRVRVLRKPVDLPNLIGILDAVDDAHDAKLAAAG